MRRRAFLAALGGAVVGLPRALPAQQPDRVRKIGILMPYPDGDPEVRARLAAFQGELRRLGWSTGINLRLDERWATDDLDRVRAASAELVRLEPDVIFFTGGRVTRIIQAADPRRSRPSSSASATRSAKVSWQALRDPAGT